VSAFLSALSAETFLNRLEVHQHDLTDRNLRSVGFVEHAMCAGRIIKASKTKNY